MQREKAELFAGKRSGYDVVIHLDERPPMDHIETVAGSRTEFWTDWEIADTRKLRPAQRRLFFALLADIYNWSFQPPESLKQYFYLKFASKYDGKQISIADETESSVTDGNNLIEIVIDFIFENNVELADSLGLLTKSDSHYLYQCCRHRRCFECGKHADIHHIDTIGMGGNRNKVDHTKRSVMALCRKHHQEIEQIGSEAFSQKYHIPINGIRLNIETLKSIGVRGQYKETE